MPISTPEVYNQMLDTAKKGGFAFPAINCTSSELSAAGGELDDAVGLCLGKATEGGGDGLGGGAVDSRECEAALLGGVQHLVIELRSCDWHEVP